MRVRCYGWKYLTILSQICFQNSLAWHTRLFKNQMKPDFSAFSLFSPPTLTFYSNQTSFDSLHFLSFFLRGTLSPLLCLSSWPSLEPPQMALMSRKVCKLLAYPRPNQVWLHPWHLPGLLWDPGTSSSNHPLSYSLYQPLPHDHWLPHVISSDDLFLFLLSTFTVLSLP